MRYDSEMVKQFTQANKEEIENLVKRNPTLGNLLKKALESMTGEEKPTSVDFQYAPEETPKNAIFDKSGIIWKSLDETDDLKFELNFSKRPPFSQRVDAVIQFININLESPQKSILLQDALKALLLIGGFYELYASKSNIEKYEAKTNKQINPAKKIVEYEISTEFVDAFGISKIDIEYDTLSEGMENIVESMITNVFKFDEKSDLTKKRLAEQVQNAMILQFLNGEGNLGFYNYVQGGLTIPKGWYQVLETSNKEVVLENALGKTAKYDIVNLDIKVNRNIVAINKPKFNKGDEVKVINKTVPNYNMTGEILRINSVDFRYNTYYYDVQFKDTTLALLESELEKLEFKITTKPKPQQKSTLPRPTTPQEIEISLMSKDQLKQLKEEFEETLTYLDDTDPEKNDLLGQIKFLNLYLEN